MADARQELIELRRLAELEQKAAPKAPEKGFTESASDFFSPFPSQQQAGENLDSYKAMLAAGAQGITGGKADEMLAALSAAGAVPVTGAIDIANRLGADIPNPLAGKGVSEGMGQAYNAALEQNRAGYKEAVAGHPYAEAAGVIGGSIYNPINKIIPTGGGMMATGAQGALLGADYGFSSGEGGFRERAANAIEQGLVGGALGAAGGAVASGAKYVAGKIGNKINPAPKAQEILDKYVEVKDYAQKTGGVISPRALDVTLRVMERKTPKSKIGIARAAKEGSAVTEARDFLSQFKGKPLSFDDVEEADKYISNLITAEYTAKKGATGDAVALKDIQETFRRMVAKDAPAGSGFKAKRDAQFLYTQKSKISELEAIIDRASRTDNPATSLKNQLNQLLNNKKAVRSFTDKERKLIRDAVETGKGTEVLRAAGSRLVPIAQVAMGDFTGAAAQVAASDIARKTAGAIQIEKLNRVINEISRTAEGKIRTINYLNKPPSALPKYPKLDDIVERPARTRGGSQGIRSIENPNLKTKIKNLAKDESGSVGGLPDDYASRMARAKEMGFDVDNPVYHGTDKSFNEFSNSVQNHGRQSEKGVHFFTSSKEEAQNYGKNVKEVYQSMKNPEEYYIDSNMNPTDYYDELPFDPIKAAKDAGRDGITIENANGDKLVVIFDPKNIRSVNAKFDPSKANSADLMSMRVPLTAGGLGAAGYSMQPGKAEATPLKITITPKRNQP